MTLQRRVLLLGSLARVPSEAFALAVVLATAAEGRDPATAAVVIAAATMPQLVTGPVVGRALDRSPRPDRIVPAAAGATAGAMLVLALWRAEPIAAIAAGLVLSATSPVLTGGLSGLIGRWGGDTHQLAAWDGVAYNTAGLAAPILVTALTTWSATSCFVALGALSAAACVVRVPAAGPADGHRDGPADAAIGVVAALRTIWRTPSLRAVTVATTVHAAAWGGFELALAARFIDAGQVGLAGVVVSVVAVAALGGSLALTRVRREVDPARMTIVGVLGSAVAVAALAAESWVVIAVAGLAVGLLDAVVLVGTYRTRHRDTPPHLRASVFTLAASAKLGASSLGALAVGAVVGGHPGGAGLLTVATTVAAAGVAGLLLLPAVTRWSRWTRWRPSWRR